MSVLSEDLNITLGTIEDNCTSIRPWVNNTLDSFMLRKIFSLPMYDEYQLKRYGGYVEIDHYTLINRAGAKLIDVFKGMNIEDLTGPLIASTLEMADIHVDTIVCNNHGKQFDDRQPMRSQLIFELYRYNKRGRLKMFAWLEVVDHFYNREKWMGVWRMWSGYKKNAGQISRNWSWGLPIYQAPRTHILQ